jgi:hypothetical protein
LALTWRSPLLGKVPKLVTLLNFVREADFLLLPARHPIGPRPLQKSSKLAERMTFWANLAEKSLSQE